MDIISRAAWGARPPKSVTTVPLSERRQLIVHYSAANKNQSVRAIQDFHMDTNGWTDIGYNFLCDHLGRLYMGRGWNALGTHTVGFNRTGIAVCFIGTNADVTEVAKHGIRWLAEEADRLTGRALTRGGHRDYDQTSCPGDNLYTWVHSGMPIQEVDMFEESDRHALLTLKNQLGSLLELDDTWISPGGSVYPNKAAAGITELLDRPPVTLTDEQVDAIAAQLITATDTPLGDADKPAIVAAVKQALREGTG